VAEPEDHAHLLIAFYGTLLADSRKLIGEVPRLAKAAENYASTHFIGLLDLLALSGFF
jgi:hypothetical protein